MVMTINMEKTDENGKKIPPFGHGWEQSKPAPRKPMTKWEKRRIAGDLLQGLAFILLLVMWVFLLADYLAIGALVGITAIALMKAAWKMI